MHGCLHYDNASSHRSELVKQYLNSEKIIVLPYSVIHYTLQTLKWSYLFVLTSPNKLLTVPSFGTSIQSKYVLIVLHINYEKFLIPLHAFNICSISIKKMMFWGVFWGDFFKHRKPYNLIKLAKKKKEAFILKFNWEAKSFITIW